MKDGTSSPGGTGVTPPAGAPFVTASTGVFAGAYGAPGGF